jgi:hypothetical protein
MKQYLSPMVAVKVLHETSTKEFVAAVKNAGDHGDA